MTTIKQKLVASKLVENGGNVGKAMIDAGYSPATAKTPQKLTKSKGWQEIMDEMFPNELLLKKHKELLNAKKLVIDHWNGKTEIIKMIDNVAVGKALDLAYKIKGYYHPSGNYNLERTNNLENFNISDDVMKRITE